MCKTYDIRKLQRRAQNAYGRLLELEDAIRAVLGNTQGMASRAQKAAHEMYSLVNALNLRAIEHRDPRGCKSRHLPEAERLTNFSTTGD